MQSHYAHCSFYLRVQSMYVQIKGAGNVTYRVRVSRVSEGGVVNSGLHFK